MLPVLGKKAVLEWCMKEGLIGSSYVCPKCKKSMELRERTAIGVSSRPKLNGIVRGKACLHVLRRRPSDRLPRLTQTYPIMPDVMDMIESNID
ncbi:hypothetical protein TNCV_4242821 [Trichonephila clavipes]|nr:hypothetical protein TNCV_4242821 [Trichonephila clavipes]